MALLEVPLHRALRCEGQATGNWISQYITGIETTFQIYCELQCQTIEAEKQCTHSIITQYGPVSDSRLYKSVHPRNADYPSRCPILAALICRILRTSSRVLHCAPDAALRRELLADDAVLGEGASNFVGRAADGSLLFKVVLVTQEKGRDGEMGWL